MVKGNEKGPRNEREFARLTKGEKISRVGYDGPDVRAFGLLFECKSGKQVPKSLYKWLDQHETTEALALKRDYKGWLAVLPVETLRELLNNDATCDRCRRIQEIIDAGD